MVQNPYLKYLNKSAPESASYFGQRCLFLSTVQSITVVGLVGQTVTLSCKYNTNTHHITSTCWGRGKVPWSRCADPLLSTNDGGRVTYRESERYQLHGRVKEGDVSLSIQNVEENDSGIYGCRVELPGWFNDLKINIRLTIIKGKTHVGAFASVVGGTVSSTTQLTVFLLST